jgi:hypothetical protein
MDFNKKWEGGGEGEDIDRIEEGTNQRQEIRHVKH